MTDTTKRETIFEQWNREFCEALAGLWEHYGSSYMDWPLNNRDADVVVKRDTDGSNFQRSVEIRGVRVGWISRLGGYGDEPVRWHAYFRRPGEVEGKSLRNDPSKMRYAAQAIVNEAHKQAERAARYAGTPEEARTFTVSTW